VVKLKPRGIIVLVLFVLWLQASLVWVHAYSGDQLSDPLSSNPVTIDGKWTTNDEWSDALKVELVNTGSVQTSAGSFYLKHDTSNFYFLIDFVSATAMYDDQKDGGGVTLDSAHDDGPAAKPDDMRFDSRQGGILRLGTGSSTALSSPKALPAGVQIVGSKSASPNAATPHMIYEFMIAFSVLPTARNTIGFAIAAYTNMGSAQLVQWPGTYILAVPQTYGELTLSPTPIPEFDFVPIVMTLTVLSALIVVRSHSRRGRAVAESPMHE
jgi:hypothetical protein